MYVVADSNFYLHHPTQFDQVDVHQLISDAGRYDALMNSRRAVNLLIPTRVIAELDKAKMSGKNSGRPGPTAPGCRSSPVWERLAHQRQRREAATGTVAMDLAGAPGARSAVGSTSARADG